MNKTEEQSNPFGITRDELLDIAAQKLADQYANEDDLSSMVNKIVGERIKHAVDSTFTAKIDAFLAVEMDKLLRTEVCPVDLWGAATGKPTTIRDALAARARTYWDDPVDSEGKLSSGYSTQPRHKYMFAKIVGEQFEGAVKQNLVNLIGAFKDAIRADYAKRADEYLNELIKVRTAGDKR